MSQRQAPAAQPTCHILREDPDLTDGLEPLRRERAIQECIAPTIRIPMGHWNGKVPDSMEGGIGLLVLDGLLLRHVGIDGRFGGELLGSGDLLRPWQGENAQPTIPSTTAWRVLKPTRLAILDRAAAHRLARFPELTGHLVERALERSRNLSIAIAIVHHPRVELRLHMLLWHLADRWGQVRPDGIAIPIRIAHTLLADLIAAQRPSVSTAISELTRRGLVIPIDSGGWVLRGNPTRGTGQTTRHGARSPNAASPRMTETRGNTNQRSYYAHRVAHPQATSSDLVPSLRLHQPAPRGAARAVASTPAHKPGSPYPRAFSLASARAANATQPAGPDLCRPDLVAPQTILPRCPNSGPSRSKHKRKCSNPDTRGSTSKAHVS